MSLTHDEASATLRDIEAAERRSANAYGYRAAAPHLLLWGPIWIVGYGLPWLEPGTGKWIWLPLAFIGMAASFAIGIYTRPKSSRRDARFAQTFLAIFAFIWAQLATIPHFSAVQAVVYFPLLVALMYMLMGIWTRGLRMALLGVAVGALTLTGYFLLPQFILPWMAVVGGGGLVLGGLWLRTA